MAAPILAAGLMPRPGFGVPALRTTSFREGWVWSILTLVARGYLSFVMTLGCIAVVPVVFGWQSFVVQTESMEPRINPGDVVVTSALPGPDSVAMGRVVAFRDTSRPGASEQAPVVVVHRVVARAQGGGFVTRGDHNQSNDSSTLARDSIVGLGRILVPLAGLPIVWWSQGAYLLLLLWLLLTAAAVVIVAITPLWAEDRDRPAPRPSDESGSGPTDIPPLAAKRAVHVAWSGRRLAFVRAVIIASVLAILAAIGLRTADAAFSATSTSAANSWTAASVYYLQSADFTTYYTAGTGNGSVSWSGSTVNMTKIATILSNSSRVDVTFSVTGSMPTAATQRGYSLWARASATGSGSTTKITGYEFRFDDQNNKFVFTWWNNGVERSTALATVNFPSGFDPKAAHAIALTLFGRSVQVTIDGSIILTYTLPTSPASFNGSNVALPTGGRYGLRTWQSTAVVRGTQMSASASTGVAGLGMTLMALDCVAVDPTLDRGIPIDAMPVDRPASDGSASDTTGADAAASLDPATPIAITEIKRGAAVKGSGAVADPNADATVVPAAAPDPSAVPTAAPDPSAVPTAAPDPSASPAVTPEALPSKDPNASPGALLTDALGILPACPELVVDPAAPGDPMITPTTDPGLPLTSASPEPSASTGPQPVLPASPEPVAFPLPVGPPDAPPTPIVATPAETALVPPAPAVEPPAAP